MKSWTTLALIPFLSFGLFTANHTEPTLQGADTYHAFGLTHTAVDGAVLAAVDGALHVAPGAGGGVATDLRRGAVNNLYLDGVILPDGTTFNTLVRAPGGGVVVHLNHRQVGDRTELTGNFAAVAAASPTITVETYVGATRTGSWSGPAGVDVTLGAVTSSAAWAKSVHVVCSEGDCSVVYDPAPAETFEFADGASAPFNYLVFTVHEVDPELFSGQVELTADGLSSFAITAADDLPMPW